MKKKSLTRMIEVKTIKELPSYEQKTYIAIVNGSPCVLPDHVDCLEDEGEGEEGSSVS